MSPTPPTSRTRRPRTASGQGDDRKHDCEFPQPGCDETGCCDDDLVDPPPDDDDGGDEAPLPDID